MRLKLELRTGEIINVTADAAERYEQAQEQAEEQAAALQARNFMEDTMQRARRLALAGVRGALQTFQSAREGLAAALETVTQVRTLTNYIELIQSRSIQFNPI